MAKLKSFLYSSSIIRIILIGVLVRLLLMPFTGHTDLILTNRIAEVLARGGLFSRGFYSLESATYPPLIFHFFAIWQKIITIFGAGDFNRWLNQSELVIYNDPREYRYFFLLKLPYLLVDLITINLILSILQNKTSDVKKVTTLFWAFNPVILYSAFMWGAFDIIIGSVTVGSLWLINKTKYTLGIALLGVGAAFKFFPLFLIPFVAIFVYKTWRSRFFGLIVGLLPFIIIIAPYISDSGFVQHVLMSGKTDIIFSAVLYVGYHKFIYLFLCAYLLLLFWYAKNGSFRNISLWSLFLTVYLFFFIFVAATPQWAVWIIPLLAIHFALYPKQRVNYIWLLIGWLLNITTFDALSGIGLLAPIEPSFWTSSELKDILLHFVKDFTSIWSVFSTFLSVSLIWFMYDYWKHRFEEGI